MVETLDVGCGLYPHGTVNLDIVVCRASNFVRGDAHHLPFQSKCFKKVLCHHTLEHLRDPILAVKEMGRVANGEIEIVVPWRLCEMIHNRFLPWRRKWASKEHKWHFSKRQLEKVLADSGLRGYVCYQFRLFRILKNFRQNMKLKQFIFYGLLGTLLPPLPELKVLIIC